MIYALILNVKKLRDNKKMIFYCNTSFFAIYLIIICPYLYIIIISLICLLYWIIKFLKKLIVEDGIYEHIYFCGYYFKIIQILLYSKHFITLLKHDNKLF